MNNDHGKNTESIEFYKSLIQEYINNKFAKMGEPLRALTITHYCDICPNYYDEDFSKRVWILQVNFIDSDGRPRVIHLKDRISDIVAYSKNNVK